MRRIVLPLVIAALVCAAYGCKAKEPAATAPAADDPSAPREAFVRLFGAVRDQNDAAVLDLVHSESPVWDRERFQDKADREKLWAKLAGQIRETGTQAEVVGVTFADGKATVTAEFRPTVPGYETRRVAFLFRRDAGYWRFWMDNRPLLFAARKVAEGEAPAPSADAPADDKAAKAAKPPAKKGGTMSMVHMESGRRDAVAKPAARPAEKRK